MTIHLYLFKLNIFIKINLFILSLNSGKTSRCQINKKNSYLKALVLNLLSSTFEGKINVNIIFPLPLVNFLDLKITQFIIIRKKLFFDLSYKNENVSDVFFSL